MSTIRRTIMGCNSGINTDDYLTFRASVNNFSVTFNLTGVGEGPEYCVDGNGIWKPLESGVSSETINEGQTISIRAKLAPKNVLSGIGIFRGSKDYTLEGNVLSMIYGDDAPNNNSLADYSLVFYRLFYGETTLRRISKNFLPATILGKQCYAQMFYACTKLLGTVYLPATTLAQQCYQSMFYNTSISSAFLYARTPTTNCAMTMFSQCSKLSTIGVRFNTPLTNAYAFNWVDGVSSTGSFINGSGLTWTGVTYGPNGVPEGWELSNFEFD